MEFPNEELKVSAGKLLCSACWEEVGLKRSTIHNHVKSHQHVTSKRKLAVKNKQYQDIAEALESHNEKVHLQGETLPLSKLDTFRDFFEEGAYRLTDKRHMSDLVPFMLKQEEGRILSEISGKALSVIFDGTSWVLLTHFRPRW